MSTLSNEIEKFIKEMMNENDEFVSIGRNDLADRFKCAPSQINYVLTTRFSPDRGYVVESRRGGGGYVKVIRVHRDPDDYIRNIISEIPKEGVSERTAKQITEGLYESGYVEMPHAKTIMNVLSDRTLNIVANEDRDRLRGHLLKQILVSLLA